MVESALLKLSRLSVESALLKLPVTLSKEPNGRQAHLFQARVPGTATLGEGAGSWGYQGGSQGFSARWRETPAQARPHPGKVPARARTIAPAPIAPIAPREVLTSGAEPQAGPASPSCHTRHGRAAQAAEKKETPAAEA